MKIGILGLGTHAKMLEYYLSRIYGKMNVELIDPIKPFVPLGDMKYINSVTNIKFMIETTEMLEGCELLKFIHPTSFVEDNAKIGNGVTIWANATVDYGCEVGHNSWIDTGAVLCHDAKVGDNCFIAPNVTLLGNCVIPDNTFIGAGAIIYDNTMVNIPVVHAGTIWRDKVHSTISEWRYH